MVSLLIGTIVALLIAEGIVRLFFPESILPRFVIDGGYGVRANQPNIVTRHYVPGDYDVTISTNSAGMRGVREYSIEKPAGVHRIAVIGDSFIFGFGANDNEVISAVLEKALNKNASRNGLRYEVINLSVSGFGQAEQLITYRELIRNYDLDYVILFYFSNDIGNNAVSGLFTVDSNTEIQRTDASYLPGVKAREFLYGVPAIRWLFTHSQAWNLVRNRLSALVQKSLLKKQGLKNFSDTQPKAVELTRALLRQFIKDISSDGARSAVFIIPGKNQESNFPLTPEEVIMAGASLIDGRYFLGPNDYYVIDSHWRASGHRKAASAVLDAIADSR